MVVSSNANSSQPIIVWRKLHQAEQGRDDEIKSVTFIVSVEVGNNSTCVFYLAIRV